MLARSFVPKSVAHEKLATLLGRNGNLYAAIVVSVMVAILILPFFAPHDPYQTHFLSGYRYSGGTAWVQKSGSAPAASTLAARWASKGCLPPAGCCAAAARAPATTVETAARFVTAPCPSTAAEPLDQRCSDGGVRTTIRRISVMSSMA